MVKTPIVMLCNWAEFLSFSCQWL